MWQFIVSGYVPGTELQITFDIIATFGCSLIIVYILWRLTLGRDRLYKQYLIDEQNDNLEKNTQGNNSLFA